MPTHAPDKPERFATALKLVFEFVFQSEQDHSTAGLKPNFQGRHMLFKLLALRYICRESGIYHQV